MMAAQKHLRKLSDLVPSEQNIVVHGAPAEVRFTRHLELSTRCSGIAVTEPDVST
jgi:hypothetical protein